MNPASLRLEELQNRDRELKTRLTQLGEMRPGSLLERYRRCGKPNCHCARRGDRGHGPMWMVTHAVEGKTVSKAIPSGPAVERTRSQIAEYQRFRELARELVVTNEQLCDARLEESRGPSASENKKTVLAEGMAAEVEQEVKALLGAAAVEELDLEAVETALRRRALRVAARLLEAHLNADLSDESGATRRCACGHPARYVGRRAKRFQSVLGELNLERAYYHCAQCGQGCCPRDEALGLEGATASPAVQRMVASVGAAVSFEEGNTLLRELADVEVDAKQVERIAEGLGAEIAEQEQRGSEPLSGEPSAATLYLGMDGTGVPMRPTELRDRLGKEPDGSGQDARGQAVHGVERRGAGRGRAAGTRRGFGELFGRHRERGHAGHRPAAF